jgi:hypothetical protein
MEHDDSIIRVAAAELVGKLLAGDALKQLGNVSLFRHLAPYGSSLGLWGFGSPQLEEPTYGIEVAVETASVERKRLQGARGLFLVTHDGIET